MSNLPLSQAAIVTTDPAAIGIRNLIEEENSLMDYATWVTVPQGNPTHRWFEEAALSSASFRAINASYTADYARLIPKQEPLAILGGETVVDIAIPALYGNDLPGNSIMAYQLAAKARAAYRKWEETFLEGDVGVDPNAFDGLRVRCIERNMEFNMAAGTDRGELTLAAVDEVLSAVVGTKVIITNQWIARKFSALVRAAGQAREMVSGEFGRMFDAYAGVPIVVNQRRNDMTTMLGFDEDPGDGGNDAASLYVVHFGSADEDQAVMALVGAAGAWDVQMVEGGGATAPVEKARLEVYVGMAMHGNRGAARLKGIGQL